MAENIYGPDVASFKGKSVRKSCVVTLGALVGEGMVRLLLLLLLRVVAVVVVLVLVLVLVLLLRASELRRIVVSSISNA